MIRWTETPPTKPGYYWWRDLTNESGRQPVEIFYLGGLLYMMVFGEMYGQELSGEWGPEIVLRDETKGGK